MAEQKQPTEAAAAGETQEVGKSSVTAPDVTIVHGDKPAEQAPATVGKGTRVRYCYRPNGFPNVVTTTATVEKLYKPKAGDKDKRRHADLIVAMPCGRSGAPELRERSRVVECEPASEGGKRVAKPNTWWVPEEDPATKEQPKAGTPSG